jgi:hypothetical protein
MYIINFIYTYVIPIYVDTFTCMSICIFPSIYMFMIWKN